MVSRHAPTMRSGPREQARASGSVREWVRFLDTFCERMLTPADMAAIKNPRRKIALLVLATALLAPSGCTPPGPDALLKGDALLREGRPLAAVEKLEQARDLMRNDPRVWNLLGVAYHRANKPQPAAQAYRQALLLDRSNVVAVAHFNLGCLLLEQNAAATAAEELRSYTLMVKDATGLARLGSAQTRLRQFAEAEKSFSAALKLDAKNAEAWNGLGVLHAQRGQRDAAQYFASALQAAPNHPPALLNSAVLAQQNPATKAVALAHYREFLAAQKNSPQTEAVKLIARQLETELAPAPNPPPAFVNVTRTNLPAVSNAATTTPALTNKNPALFAVKTNPPVSVVKTNPVVAASNPPGTPATIVAVTNTVPPRAAIAEPPNQPAPVPSAPVRDIAAGSPAISPGLITPRNPDPPKKPGFFAKLNPFGKKPAAVTNSVPQKIVLNAANVTPTEPAAPQPAAKPVFPRYAYLSPAPPAAGNRAAAELALQQAVAVQRAGRTGDALPAYQTALAADASYFDAQYGTALFALQTGDLKRALAGGETALALQPDSINARYVSRSRSSSQITRTMPPTNWRKSSRRNRRNRAPTWRWGIFARNNSPSRTRPGCITGRCWSWTRTARRVRRFDSGWPRILDAVNGRDGVQRTPASQGSSLVASSSPIFRRTFRSG